MENNINGIVLQGKFYETVKRGSRHCSDCDLFYECVEGRYIGVCMTMQDEIKEPIIFRFSQEMTDKIKGK